MIRTALIAITAALVASWSVAARKIRQAETDRKHDAASVEARYVDMSVRLRVVRQDLVNGTKYLADAPRLAVLHEEVYGGIVDLNPDDGGRARLVGPGANPANWYCSEEQEPLILHDDDQPLWTLIQGSEGSGKTTTLAMWAYFRVLEHIGHDREIGITAPTNKRMAKVVKAIRKLWRTDWIKFSRGADDTTVAPSGRDQAYTFRAGPTVQLQSAHQQSEAEGSPIQGDNWVAHAGDELQDHFDVEADIEARGRSAPDGRYKRLNTSTGKDSTEWRNFREKVQTSDAATPGGLPVWLFVKMDGRRSPFVDPLHWANLRSGGTMTEREFRRRVGNEDLPPESQVYHCFTRKLEDGSPGNLRPLPLGAIDVTAEVLAAHRPIGDPRPITLLLGHDPGKRQHVTEFHKAYRFPEDIRRGDMRPRWFVVDEVTSPDSIMHDHASAVLKRAREKWNCNTLNRAGKPDLENGRQLLARIDPHTRAEKSDHPGPDVKATWAALGMLAKAAAYKPGTADPAQIPIESRLNMMNTLFCATAGADGVEVAPLPTSDGLPVKGKVIRRLFILCDDKGNAAAPKLLAAVESMERDAGGAAETERKDKNDLSHWPCASGYALWQIEHQRAGQAAA